MTYGLLGLKPSRVGGSGHGLRRLRLLVGLGWSRHFEVEACKLSVKQGRIRLVEEGKEEEEAMTVA